MQVLFVAGRVIFALFFIFAGVQRLLDISGTAALITNKFTMLSALLGPATSIESTIGMSMPQLLAILSGAIELAAGILFSFNIGTRAMAGLLFLFTAVGIFYVNDFWNMAGDVRANNIEQTMKNISLIGGLLVFMAMGSWQPDDRRRASENI
jgi:putative oxidoreductase